MTHVTVLASRNAIPGYQRIAVPRLMGFSRLGSMPFTQWTVDGPSLVARERHLRR